MGAFTEVLMRNGVYAVAGWGALALGLIALAAGILWLARHGLDMWPSKKPEALKALRRLVWRATFGTILTLGVLFAAALGVVSSLGVRLDEKIAARLTQMESTDWLILALPALKTLALVALALLASRVVRSLVKQVGGRLDRSQILSGRGDLVSDLLGRLHLVLSAALLFGTLILAGQLLRMPSPGEHVLWSIAYLGVAVYLARLAVGVAHLAIDTALDLSKRIESPNNPLRYIARFNHLGTLTKSTADYLIYVGFATWAIDHITPDTWASRAGVTALHIIAIFYLSRVLVEVCILGLNEILLARQDLSPGELQQRQTMVPVATGLLRYGIYFTAVVMALTEAGFDPTPLLAGAGVAGLAIGLGAQSLVGDLVAGFFILFENLYLVGDLIEVDDVAGRVEEIGVRVTRIRDEAGVLHAIPNGEVRKVSSHSRGYVNVIVDIPLPYGENVHAVIAALNGKLVELRLHQSDIIGPTEMAVEELRESSVLLRTVTMVKPGTTEEMGDVLRLAFWEVLAEAGVTAPYSRHAVVTPPPPARLASGPRAPTESVERTDIQRIKAYNLYLALDVNGNGHIERSDVETLGQRLTTHNQLTEADPAAALLTRELDGYWSAIVGSVDADQDGRISQEEFLQFCAGIARDFSGPGAQSIDALADAMFLVSDRNRTDKLSVAEFQAFARAFGLSEAVATAGFHLIDRGSTGTITQAAWRTFMRDVFVSKKLSDAAAVVFGPGCRDDAQG